LVKDLWEYDKIKKEALTTRGYEVHVIWEKEWRSNRSAVLQDVKTWLKL